MTATFGPRQQNEAARLARSLWGYSMDLLEVTDDAERAYQLAVAIEAQAAALRALAKRAGGTAPVAVEPVAVPDWTCPDCGARFPDGHRPDCPNPDNAEDDALQCSIHGHEDNGAGRCEACGRPMQKETDR